MVLLIGTLLVIGVTFILTESVYKLADTQKNVKLGATEAHEDEEAESTKVAKQLQKRVLLFLWPTLGLNVALGIIGVLSIIPYRSFITPFGNSLWVYLTLIWAVSSIILSLRYSDWLFLQSSKITVTQGDWFITWALALAVLASLAVGLWLFGKNNLPAYLVADIIFVTVVLATFFGMIYVAVSMGGQFQSTLGKIGMGFYRVLALAATTRRRVITAQEGHLVDRRVGNSPVLWVHVVRESLSGAKLQVEADGPLGGLWCDDASTTPFCFLVAFELE